MRKEIMQALQQEYEQQRLKNSQEELRRRQEVITRCPEIGQYLAERQNLIFGGVRGILNGKAAADDLPARMDVMNKRIAGLLRQSGFPADYLDPVYRCKQCRFAKCARACAVRSMRGCTARSAWAKRRSSRSPRLTRKCSPISRCRAKSTASGN